MVKKMKPILRIKPVELTVFIADPNSKTPRTPIREWVSQEEVIELDTLARLCKDDFVTTKTTSWKTYGAAAVIFAILFASLVAVCASSPAAQAMLLESFSQGELIGKLLLVGGFSGLFILVLHRNGGLEIFEKRMSQSLDLWTEDDIELGLS